MYVLRVEPDSRRVVVGPDARLLATEVELAGCRWLREVAPGEPLAARVRHRGALAPCAVARADGGRATIALRAPLRAVTPGQSAVLYVGDELVGGGYVSAARTLSVAPVRETGATA